MVYITVQRAITLETGVKTMYLLEAIRKNAASERMGDALLGGLSTQILGAVVPGGHLTGVAGTASGLLEDDAKESLKGRGTTAKSLIPGVGGYRQGAVMRAVADEGGDRGRKQLIHEMLGAVAGRVGGAAVGAGIGAGIGAASGGATSDEMKIGGMAGAAAGALLPEMTAGILALVKKTRTKKEQGKHEKDNVIKNYIPGVGSYNQYKRLGTGYDRYFEGKTKINKNAGDKSMSHLTDAIVGQTSEPRKQAVRNLLSKEAEYEITVEETLGKPYQPGQTPNEPTVANRNSLAAPTKSEIDAYRKKMNKPKKGSDAGDSGITGKLKSKKLMKKEASDRKDYVRTYLKKLAAEKCGEEGHYCSECEKYGESTTCGCGSDCGCDINKEAADSTCPTCGTACQSCKDSMKKEANDKLLMTSNQFKKGMETNNQPAVDAKGNKSQALKDAIAARKKRMAPKPKAGTFNKLKGKSTQQQLRKNMYN